MARSYHRSDFPLPPLDRDGHPLKVGDEVQIIGLPDVDFQGFDARARARYCALQDCVLPITAFDELGYAVFGLWYASASAVVGRIPLRAVNPAPAHCRRNMRRR